MAVKNRIDPSKSKESKYQKIFHSVKSLEEYLAGRKFGRFGGFVQNSPN